MNKELIKPCFVFLGSDIGIKFSPIIIMIIKKYFNSILWLFKGKSNCEGGNERGTKRKG